MKGPNTLGNPKGATDMPNEILREYLDVGLFRIGDDDTRLKVFQAAANDLSSAFGESPGSVISSTLVSVDPAVPETDPVLGRAEAAIKVHWNTFGNKYDQRPVGLLRAVLLDALNQAAHGNRGIAAAIWLTGANLASRVELGSERQLVEGMLRAHGDATEQGAVNRFRVPDLNVPVPNLTPSTREDVSVDSDAFELRVVAATGPQDQQGRQLEDPNPHWPNQHQAWGYQFAPRIAAAISEELDSVASSLSEQTSAVVGELEEKLNQFATALARRSDTAIAGALHTSLLWLKESLYSPSLRTSYRELTPAELVVGMGEDLIQSCSLPAPQSVEYFLREMVLVALAGDPEITISDLLSAVKASERLSSLVAPASPPHTPERVCLRTALSFARHSGLAIEDLPAWLGVSGDLKVHASALAVWLFRDSQAIGLLSEQNPQ